MSVFGNKRMPPFSTNRRTEATQDLPRSPSRILPKSRSVTYYLSLQKQSIKHIHQNITDNSLHTASHNNQYSYAPCILQKVQDKRSNVTKSGYKRKQIQSACTRINQSIVRQHCKHNEESGKIRATLNSSGLLLSSSSDSSVISLERR